MAVNKSISEPGMILFRECQRFRQWWLWLILIGANIPLLWALWQQSREGAPLDPGDLLLGNGILLLVIFLLLALRLDTEIRNDGVYVRFFPFALRLKRYGWEEIEKAYVRPYKPLLEYGGWGIRYGRKGKALNVSGNMGLQLELKNGKKLLIGTRKPEALQAVIEELEVAG